MSLFCPITRDTGLSDQYVERTAQVAGIIEAKSLFNTVFVLNRECVHHYAIRGLLAEVDLVHESVPAQVVSVHALPFLFTEAGARVVLTDLGEVLCGR